MIKVIKPPHPVTKAGANIQAVFLELLKTGKQK
jgi:hypothetical protein